MSKRENATEQKQEPVAQRASRHRRHHKLVVDERVVGEVLGGRDHVDVGVLGYVCPDLKRGLVLRIILTCNLLTVAKYRMIYLKVPDI